MCSRAPSATAIGRARLLDKRMVCNKKSRDGSGKANLVGSRGDLVWGVLYEIDSAELDKLDQIECDYQRVKLHILTEQDNSIPAYVYISVNLTNDPVPYKWYKDLIIMGARKHQLPKDYLEYLEQIPSKPDLRKRGCNFV